MLCALAALLALSLPAAEATRPAAPGEVDPAFAAAAPFAMARLPVPRAEVDVALGSGERAAADADVLAWVGAATRAVTAYYGRFPVARAQIVVVPGRAEGTTWNGRLIRLGLDPRATAADLADDWRATHECCHLAFPDLGRGHRWTEEGMATYVEPWARCAIGTQRPERAWRDLVDGLPKGFPGKGDGGLDARRDWGATYWGGALFWLLADVEAREATGGARGVREALRAVLDAGGDGSVTWPIERVLATCDRATGTSAFSDVYARVAQRPYRPDLDALWRRLGVRRDGDRVTLDDDAPEAAIRRAIEMPKP